MTPLRVGVVGLGRMGRLHVQTLTRMPQWEIVGLADRNSEHREAAAAKGFHVVASSTELAPLVDVAVVATSTQDHVASTLPLLRAQVPCLVEKPLALDRDGAAALFETAAQQGVLLTVGQSERFNTGVRHAIAALRRDPHAPVEVTRTAERNPERPPTSDVVTDLLIHDLDWVVKAVGEPPTQLRTTDATWDSGQLCAVTCELSWRDARRVRLRASQIAADRRREVVVHGSDGSVERISLEQTANAKDPLTHQAEALYAAARGSREPEVTAHDVLTVLALTDQILATCPSESPETSVRP